MNNANITRYNNKIVHEFNDAHLVISYLYGNDKMTIFDRFGPRNPFLHGDDMASVVSSTELKLNVDRSLRSSESEL